MKSILNSVKKVTPFVLITVVIVAAMLLVSCTKEVYVVQATTTTMETTTTIEATTTTERPIPTTTEAPYINLTNTFLEYIHSNTSLGLYYDDNTLINIAQTICQGAESGMSGDQIIQVILEAAYGNGLTDEQIMDVATLAGAGVATFCPEYQYVFN